MSDDHKPSVVDGKLVKVSVSALKTFGHLPEEPVQSKEGCNLKWWFEKVAGFKPPDTTATGIGTEVHRQIEHYLTTGEDVLGPIARSGKPFFPEPKKQLIEHAFKTDVDGVSFEGFIDRVGLYEDQNLIEADDWKTSGNIRDERYIYGPDELTSTMHGHGVQLIGYAKALRDEFPWVRRFRLRHVSMQTKGPRDAKEIVATPTLTKVETEWETVTHRVARGMKPLAAEKDPRKVPKNLANDLSACKAFGGCPHLLRCKDVKAARAVALGFTGGSNAMSLMSKFKKAGSTPVETATPAAPTAPAPVTSFAKPISSGSAPKNLIKDESTVPDAELKAAVQKARAEKMEREGIAVHVGATSCAPGKLIQGALYQFADGLKAIFLALTNGDQYSFKADTVAAPFLVPAGTSVTFLEPPVKVLPPDAPKSDPAKAAEPLTPEHAATLSPEVREHIEAQGGVAHPSPTSASSEETKSRRGRPKGSPNKKVVEVGTEVKTEPAPLPRILPDGTVEDVLPEVSRKGFELYINCIPSTQYTLLDSYIAKIHFEVCEASGQPDMRLIEYGKGKGGLAARVRETPPVPGSYVVFGSEIADVIIEALAPMAVRVTRGVSR